MFDVKPCVLTIRLLRHSVILVSLRVGLQFEMCFPKLVVVDVSIWLMLSSLSLFWDYFVNSLWEFLIPSTCITQSVHQYLATGTLTHVQTYRLSR